MPVDSSIALAGRPPVIAPFDVKGTFLTLGQLRYLAAETAAAETNTAEAQATLAGRQRVRDLTRSGGAHAPAPTGLPLASLGQPQAGGPPFDEATLGALPQGGSTPALPETPAPGGPAAPPAAGPPPGGPAAAPGALDPYQRAQAFLDADPFEGAGPAKNVLDLVSQDLTIKKGQLDKASTALELASKLWGTVTDQASHTVARESMKDATGSYGQIPETWTAAGTTQFRDMMRTAQQRVEERQKDVELKINEHNAKSTEITARAGAQDAATRERLAKRPYTLGTGYAQDQDTPQPKLVGPQAGAPGAPRSPEGLGQSNALSGEFNAGSKEFEAATANYNQTVPLLKDKTNTSDLLALRGFQKLSEQGQAIGVFGGKQTEGLGNIMEQITGEISRLTTDKGATIAQPLREKMAATAKKWHALQIDQHLQFRDEMRAKAKDRGVPPDEVAPNRLTTYGSGGTAITQAKFKEYLADQRRKGHTRGQALLDLSEKGFYVRGGPE